MYYKIINADIVEHVAQHGGVLLQQVNCRRAAGRGLAEQIRKRWPGWYDTYVLHDGHLGDIHIYVDHAWPAMHFGRPLSPMITIVSLYAQYGYGTHQRQTDDKAFTAALVRFRNHIARTTNNPVTWMSNHGGELYVPWRIGCGLGGGDWNTILGILVAELPTNFTICKLPA